MHTGLVNSHWEYRDKLSALLQVTYLFRAFTLPFLIQVRASHLFSGRLFVFSFSLSALLQVAGLVMRHILIVSALLCFSLLYFVCPHICVLMYMSSYICVRTLRLQVVGLSSGNTDLIEVNKYLASGTTTTHLTPSESAPPDIQKVHV
jgi:hypothetical protein